MTQSQLVSRVMMMVAYSFDSHDLLLQSVVLMTADVIDMLCN